MAIIACNNPLKKDNFRSSGYHPDPPYYKDSNWFLNFEDAKSYYQQLQNLGFSPVFLLLANNNGLIVDNPNYEIYPNGALNQNNFSLDRSGSFDYCTLVQIDTGNGMHAAWMHATEGWGDGNGQVVIDPVDNYNESRKTAFIIVKNACRPNAKFKTNFDISNVTGSGIGPKHILPLINAR